MNSCVHEIKEKQGIILSSEDETALEVASLLHDIGKINGETDHPKKSVDYIEKYLIDEGYTPSLRKRIRFLILNHSNKKNRIEDHALNLLLDADALDEIGMQSILMSSHWVDNSNGFFFKTLEERLAGKELIYIQQVAELLFYDASKEILEGKVNFIKLATQQLIYENKGSLSKETYDALLSDMSK